MICEYEDGWFPIHAYDEIFLKNNHAISQWKSWSLTYLAIFAHPLIGYNWWVQRGTTRTHLDE